jgi:uncharacterized protein YdbL (DUF1318 family)
MDLEGESTATGAPRTEGQTRSLVIASWVLIAAVCFISLIPFVGFGSWLIAGPILFITLIMGIIVLSRGGTVPGLCILLSSLIAAPIFIIVAPFVSSLLGLGGTAAALSSSERDSRTNSQYSVSATIPPRPTSNSLGGKIPRSPEYDTLKNQLQAQIEPVGVLKSRGLVKEGKSGYLVDTELLSIDQRRLVQQENIWREKMFALIGREAGQSGEAVAAVFARMAQANSRNSSASPTN